MAQTSFEEKFRPYIEKDLQGEQVAGLDHIGRTLARAKKFGPALSADMEVLIPGAMLHDIGVVSDKKNHYIKGKERAAEILESVDYPGDKIQNVLHVIETHSRYGGIPPETVEARIMRGIDAIDYVGA
ncbi:MAG: HD domain-containing protein [Bacillota bacterium]